MHLSPLAVGGLVFALCLAAGVVPLVLRLSPRVLHGVVAAACGFFLGITFLHLLPEIAREATSSEGSPALLWGSVLAGLLAVFLAEVLLRSGEHGESAAHEDHDHPAHHGGHRVVGIATFVGLTVHTLGGAIALGLSFDDPKMRDAFLFATLAHKSAETFSLASVLLLAALSRKSVLGLLVAFSAVTPVGLLIGRACASSIPHRLLGIAEGLAAGTFLYVAIAELLPEVFHGKSDRLLKVLLLLAGIGASALLLAHPEWHA